MIPEGFREKVLRLAHETLMSGHLGIRTCAERPKDCNGLVDKYLPALLFAVREVPQESLGFSPFELLYGRNVRGPMAILRVLWSDEVNDEQVLSTYQYVIELRERLEQTCKLARENLEKCK